MAYRTSRRTSRFRRRPSRRYSRRPLRRTFKRARPSCGRRVTLDHRELQGRTTLDLLSYLPGLSLVVMGRSSLLRLPVCSQHLWCSSSCFLCTSVGPLTSAKPLQAAAPRRQGHLQDHLALPLKTSPWSSTPTGTAIVASQQASGFSGVNG